MKAFVPIAALALALGGCAELPAQPVPAAASAAGNPAPASPPKVNVAPAASEKPAPEFGWLGDLVDSCWTGEASTSGEGAGSGAGTFCYMLQYGRMIRVGAKLATFETEAVFGIDLETRKPVYMQWASNGFISPGDITLEGETLILINRTHEGLPSKTARAIWSRPDTDTYRVRREIKDAAGNWKEFSTVDYHRVKR